MKILLDHNTPRQLRSFLSEHEVHTAAYMGWSELENGDLLEAAASHGYDLMVTCDQGQDLSQYAVTSWTVIRENVPGNRSAPTGYK